MKHVLKTMLLALILTAALSLPAVAGDGFHSVAERPGVSTGSVSTSADSTTLDAFKSLPEEQRNALLQQAIESFKSMSPEDRKALTDQAKAMGGDTGSFGAEWDKLLTEDQKKMVSDQIGGYAKDTNTASGTNTSGKNTPTTDSVTALLLQINDLSPAQKQQLLATLKRSDVTTTTSPDGTTNVIMTPKEPATAAPAAPPANADPCAEYQTVNPAMYANCTARMHPKK
jgi:hypothetical protein